MTKVMRYFLYGLKITIFLLGILFFITVILRHIDQVHDKGSFDPPINENEYEQYEDTAVSGLSVINALEDYKDAGIYLAVTNGSGTTTYYYRNFDLTRNLNTVDLAKSKEDAAHYIPVAGKFWSTVDKDSMGEVIGITFVKE